jgi:hypothetical protein
VSKARVYSALAVLTVVTSAPGCGRATRSPHPAAVAGEGATPTAGGGLGGGASGGTAGGSGSSSGGRTSSTAGVDGGEGGDTETGGTQGALAGTAGTAGAAGAAGTAGTAGAAGGADECSRAGAPCFEPCGGDPFGNWIVEAGCLTGGGLETDCTGASVEGTLRELNLRLTFDADGGLEVSGREAWDLAVRAPRACLDLDDAEPCDQGVLFTSPQLFASSRSVIACQREACGSCECSGVPDGGTTIGRLRWIASGTRLTLDGGSSLVNVPYCVEGDVLFLGGDDTSGQSRVAYKFRKRSCRKTTPPCSSRTLEECESTEDCRQGTCFRAPGFAGFCEGLAELQCAETPDCLWEPNQCGTTGGPGCDFHRCEQMAGCELGPPAPRCTGTAWCGFDVEDCNEPGCSIQNCATLGEDVTSCEELGDPALCVRGIGCSHNGVNCEGTTRCSAQTDETACSFLGCSWKSYCGGAPARSCSELTVDECHTLRGCTAEW